MLIDGNKVGTISETEGGTFSSYTYVMTNISAYLDGGTHTLTLKGTDKVAPTTSWFVDDVAILFNAIVNGSMEDDSNGDKVPDGWKISSPSGQTRRVCSMAYDGSCSVRLQGNTGSQERLIYVYKPGPTGKAGDTFALSLYGYCSGFTTHGQWGMTVEAYNTDSTVSTLFYSGFLGDTGGSWLPGSSSLIAPKDYKKIKITVWHLGNNPGVAYVDFFFMPAAGGPVPAPPLPEGPTLNGE